MKISKSRLQQIIREEVSRVIQERVGGSEQYEEGYPSIEALEMMRVSDAADMVADEYGIPFDRDTPGAFIQSMIDAYLVNVNMHSDDLKPGAEEIDQTLLAAAVVSVSSPGTTSGKKMTEDEAEIFLGHGSLTPHYDPDAGDFSVSTMSDRKNSMEWM